MIKKNTCPIYPRTLLTLLFCLDYLLSNNHVNSIIVHKFDFSDEEIMAYYISFLKTLSLKLNNHTVHFFYNEVRPQNSGNVERKRAETLAETIAVIYWHFLGLSALLL